MKIMSLARRRRKKLAFEGENTIKIVDFSPSQAKKNSILKVEIQ